MSRRESEWPASLRRRTGVDLLGPPGRFFAYVVVALSLVMVAYVGAWNAAKYPIALGYDAQANVAYAHVLLDEHHIPHPDESGEANQPPAYYFLGGVAARLGAAALGWHETDGLAGFGERSLRGAQVMNVLLALMTSLCVLWLALLVAPGRPWVAAGSVGFFAFLPVAAKTEAMFHPENLSMLASAAAIASATHVLVRRPSRVVIGILALSLGIGLAARTTVVFTAFAIVVGVGIAATAPAIRARLPWRTVGLVCAIATVALVAPWVAYRALVQHQGPLNETTHLLRAALDPRVAALKAGPPRAGFFRLWEPAIFTSPWRPVYPIEAFPKTYTDIWGDWFGVMSWSSYKTAPWVPAQQIQKDQSYIGVVPTVLALAGWLSLCYATVRRRRELAIVAVAPILGVGGYLYRSWLTLTPDGDVLKASYALNTAGVWAVGFGLTAAWIGTRSRLVGYALGLLLAIFAVLELRFMLYGIRDHRPIF